MTNTQQRGDTLASLHAIAEQLRADNPNRTFDIDGGEMVLYMGDGGPREWGIFCAAYDGRIIDCTKETTVYRDRIST